MRKFVVYCDGSSAPHRAKTAGWGIAVPLSDIDYIAFGGHLPPPSTNNVGEGWALVNAIRLFVGQRVELTCMSDSEYALKFINSRAKWEREGLPPANNDIILACWRAIDEFEAAGGVLKVQWCKGHAGTKGNEVADFAASAGRDLDKSFSRKGIIELKYGVNIKKVAFFDTVADFHTYAERQRK